MKKLIIALVLAVPVVSACTTGERSNDSPTTVTRPDETKPTGDAAPGSALGPGISVEEALSYRGDQPILVNGYLFVDSDGTTVLASAAAESYPPQPAGAVIPVTGLDLTQFDLSQEGAVRWTKKQVQILGVVDGGVLVHRDRTSA